jgi:hypothetical protein
MRRQTVRTRSHAGSGRWASRSRVQQDGQTWIPSWPCGCPRSDALHEVTSADTADADAKRADTQPRDTRTSTPGHWKAGAWTSHARTPGTGHRRSGRLDTHAHRTLDRRTLDTRMWTGRPRPRWASGPLGPHDEPTVTTTALPTTTSTTRPTTTSERPATSLRAADTGLTPGDGVTASTRPRATRRTVAPPTTRHRTSPPTTRRRQTTTCHRANATPTIRPCAFRPTRLISIAARSRTGTSGCVPPTLTGLTATATTSAARPSDPDD